MAWFRAIIELKGLHSVLEYIRKGEQAAFLAVDAADILDTGFFLVDTEDSLEPGVVARRIPKPSDRIRVITLAKI